MEAWASNVIGAKRLLGFEAQAQPEVRENQEREREEEEKQTTTGRCVVEEEEKPRQELRRSREVELLPGKERETKLTWKNKNKDNKKRSLGAISVCPDLPFDLQNDISQPNTRPDTGGREESYASNRESTKLRSSNQPSDSSDPKKLAESCLAQGTKLAKEGKYREALVKWEAALTLTPESAVLHEQKAQVLLEIADAWSALKAATRAAELEPSWAEAWITLGRAQLNFGEPDSAIESFGRAPAIKPDSEEAQDARRTVLHLVKRRKQHHSSGLCTSTSRYVVGNKSECS